MSNCNWTQGLGLKKSGRKADLVSRLAHAQLDGEPGDASVPVAAAKCKPAVDEERGALKCSAATAATPVILVLGETLQRLPLESMPCLRTNKHVSRMPALEHVFVRVGDDSGLTRHVITMSHLIGFFVAASGSTASFSG